MNFFSEKKTIYLWRIAMMEVQAPMPRCKVEDRWRLTDNILRMTRLYIHKKGKVNFMNLGWGSQPHRSNIISQPHRSDKGGQLYLSVRDIFWTLTKAARGLWQRCTIFDQCLASRVFQYRVGTGRVPGIGSGSGIFRYFGYFAKFRVIPDISSYPLPDDFQNSIGRVG